MDLIKLSASAPLRRWRSAAALQNRWVCPSCRRRDVVANRRFSSTTSSATTATTTTTTTGPAAAAEKPYYVTTPIFYVNASPHVGHMFSMVLADSLKRWQTLIGRRALLCTGTDEHGMKVQQAAAREDDPAWRDPKRFVDGTSAVFRQLAGRAQIDHDVFIRTTEARHAEAVRHFWHLLRRNGYIYESKHEGWYSVSDECFFPEATIERRQDPMTGQVYPASRETGGAVEWTEERNYHFRLTALKDRLLDFYRARPDWVVPAARMAEVVDWVENNLEDLSVSRPVDRLTWGIPVPDDPSQTIYVWVDALVNYLTVAGFPDWAPGGSSSNINDINSAHSNAWPADVHVIGKDILRFHCVYWPALLLAADLPLPRRVLSHAHWTMGRRKMSKSVGNVVNPFFAMERFGVDAVRLFLLLDGGIANDADYDNAHVVERYKKLLQWGLGNLASRVTRPKLWSVREAVESARDGVLLPLPSSSSSSSSSSLVGGQGEGEGEGNNQIFAEQAALLETLPGAVAEQMEKNLNSSAALRLVMDAVAQTNKFLAEAKPWDGAKAVAPVTAAEATLLTGPRREALRRERAGVNRTVFLAAESLRIVGILLQPFLPSKAAQLLDMLGVEPGRRGFGDARLAGDFTYGTPARDPGSGPFDALFPPLPVED